MRRASSRDARDSLRFLCAQMCGFCDALTLLRIELAAVLCLTVALCAMPSVESAMNCTDAVAMECVRSEG